MKLIVNKKFRLSVMRAHTATHLLHSQLQKIFPDTKQAGSWVGENKLRFDFFSKRLLFDNEIEEIENNINNIINEGLNVFVEEISYNDALKKGAKAFFGDKYGDLVRVVTIGNGVSIELCGGTHVSNTKDIGSFIIVGQESVASGTKRIIANVGTSVVDIVYLYKDILNKLKEDLGINSYKQISKKVLGIIDDSKKQKEELLYFKKKLIEKTFKSIKTNSDKKFNYNFDLIYNVDNSEDLKIFDLKFIFSIVPNFFIGKIVLFYKNNGSFFVYSGDKEISAKHIVNVLGRRGGGNDFLVQGKM